MLLSNAKSARLKRRSSRPVAAARRILLASILSFSPCIGLGNQRHQDIQVPVGKPVLVDGQFDESEWADAQVIPASGGIRLYVKQADNYVLICVRPPKAGAYNVDLYLAPETSQVFDLHASAKLGERQLTQSKWPDWKWWNNTGWVANTQHFDDCEDGHVQLSYAPAFEYQISRHRFPGDTWRVAVEVRLVRNNEIAETTTFPQTANTSAPSAEWLTLRFR
ncbi:MAG TPA: hypothetical protein VEZ90_16100 [Blastocatellia bacterium]|nr:hypothetical protein [Blastocatellia bacterium]